MLMHNRVYIRYSHYAAMRPYGQLHGEAF